MQPRCSFVIGLLIDGGIRMSGTFQVATSRKMKRLQRLSSGSYTRNLGYAFPNPPTPHSLTCDSQTSIATFGSSQNGAAPLTLPP
jgi:hypothetical protein